MRNEMSLIEARRGCRTLTVAVSLSFLFSVTFLSHESLAKPPTAVKELHASKHAPIGFNKSKVCLPQDQIPVQGLSLTEKETSLLGSLCWRPDLETLPLHEVAANSRGVPSGVECDVTNWCDEAGNCSKVCRRGSVQISAWLQNALKTQWALSRQRSICNATLPGTHNSAIDLADGYGNLDSQFQQYFAWIRWVADDAMLRTNDHYFSLTDQLNLGVRSVELDTHQVEGALRIAHCGGYHSDIDWLIDAVNLVAKVLGHPIHWDSETIGCNPSLSSIPVAEQRTFASALQEIGKWLKLPGNEEEFLVLYLDDQADLLDWGVLPTLFAEIQAEFPLQAIFTPLELQTQYNNTWPSIDQLSATGKRVLFVTGQDYGPVIDALMFSKEGRNTVCGWREPEFKFFEAEPECLADGNEYTGQTLSGQIFRILTCDLYYGPMNCDFVWSDSNDPLLDESTLPEVYKCGVNMPSPDLLTPSKAAATIWSWAADHPPQQSHSMSFLEGALKRIQHPLSRLFPSWSDGNNEQCAFISKEDGHWRTGSCKEPLPTACRVLGGGWTLQAGPRGECPPDSDFILPQQAKDNTLLQKTLKGAGIDAAWLPLQGPDWAVDGSPLYRKKLAI